jgi:hypothetical protein
MRRKRNHLLWTAAGAVLGITVVNAHATPTATLSIDACEGDWTAYLQLDSASDNVGLADLAIDVVGSGGAIVTSSYLDLEDSGFTIINYTQVGVGKPKAVSGENETNGFQEFPSNGTDGIGITAGQNIAYGSGNNPNLDVETVIGVGQTANLNGIDNGRYSGTFDKVTVNGTTTFSTVALPQTFDGPITWSVPVDVASGTYYGSGTLSVVLDTTIGQGIQSLNNNGSGSWNGPGNVTFDIVIPGSTIISEAAPPPFFGSATLVGADDLSGATVTPAADDVNDVITETGGGGNDSYVPIHIHLAGNGVSNGGFQFAGFHQGDAIDILLKFSNLASGTDPVPGNIQLLTDIENYIYAYDRDPSVFVSTVPAAIAADFPGTTYDLMLSLPAPGTDPFVNLDFSDFAGDGLSFGQLGVSDIGLVPEPASAGLLVLGGIGLLARRKRTARF